MAHHRHAPGLRRAVHHDQRRPGAGDVLLHDVPVRQRVQVPEHGLRQRDGVDQLLIVLALTALAFWTSKRWVHYQGRVDRVDVDVIRPIPTSTTRATPSACRRRCARPRRRCVAAGVAPARLASRHVALIVICVGVALPFVWMVSTSLKTLEDDDGVSRRSCIPSPIAAGRTTPTSSATRRPTSCCGRATR